MAPCNLKTAAPNFVGLAIATLLGPFTCTGQIVEQRSLSLAKGVVLQLRTNPFASPLVITGDPLNRSVTSLEIRGELTGDGDDKGTITLDESLLTFNEFGDATAAQLKTAPPAKSFCDV